MAAKTNQNWRLDRRDRFLVTHRDGFACRYCGSRPGSDLLEVDHLVPRTRNGTDFPENLVTACKTCNGRKSNAIVFPHDCIEREDEEGWFVHKTFGEWRICFSVDCIGIDNNFGYGFIQSDYWPDQYFWSGLYEKTWGDVRVSELLHAAFYLSRLVRLPPW